MRIFYCCYADGENKLWRRDHRDQAREPVMYHLNFSFCLDYEGKQEERRDSYEVDRRETSFICEKKGTANSSSRNCAGSEPPKRRGKRYRAPRTTEESSFGRPLWKRRSCLGGSSPCAAGSAALEFVMLHSTHFQTGDETAVPAPIATLLTCEKNSDSK